MKEKVLSLAALMCIGIISAANASSLVDMGAFTTDTATGLDWLDLTASQNRSYVEVSSQFGAGGDFSGYRYATVSEVRTFWVDAGLINGVPQTCTGTVYCFSETYPIAPVASLVSLIGNTWAASFGFGGAIGLTSTVLDSGCPIQDTCYVTPELRIFSSQNFAEAIVAEGLRDDIVNPNYSSWLVRETPLPATLSLFATGLGALGLFGWRRKKKAAGLAA